MKKATFLLVVAVFLFSFSVKKEKPPVYDAAYFDKTMVYLPMATFNMYVPDSVENVWEDKKMQTVTVSSFYIHPFEVSNGMYLSALKEIGIRNKELYEKLLPDTLVWRERLMYNEPYVEYYFRHPAYRDYPVVGVSYEQCELFCNYLTEKYNSDPNRKNKKVVFKLPAREQWYCAATGTNALSVFPWGGPYLQNKTGQWLANFKPIDQSSIIKIKGTINVNGKDSAKILYVGAPGYMSAPGGTMNDNADVTAPVKSYWPNDAGIYNLAGNVEEYIREKGFTKGGSWNDTGYYLRNDVEEKYDSTNDVTSMRGFRFVMEVVEK